MKSTNNLLKGNSIINFFKGIPTPPPTPETAIKGFNSEGYWELIQSLPSDEKQRVLEELESPEIIERAKKLEQELAQNVMTCADLDATRVMFLAALLCLQQNKITKNQLATLHLVDSAIRTLYTSPLTYLIYQFEENNKIKNIFSTFPSSTIKGFPTSVRRYAYNIALVPNAQTKINDLPQRMHEPLICRFFNFTDSEWDSFSEEMEKAPDSEKYVYVLVAPQFGCWSSIIFKIQAVLKCMQVLDWYKETDSGLLKETIMVVPTFSMFQAAINAKAKTLGRQPLKLIPTYYYVEEEQYHRYKSSGHIPMTMYLPEQESRLQYNPQEGKFRTNIDGHPAETAFAGAIHDEYHAFRELQMSENVAEARLRLATIAKNHPKNKMSFDKTAVDEILMDGELIFSYSLSKDTIFDSDCRSQKESFGDLFYTPSLKGNLHDDLKRAFIYDMVQNQEDWLENFGIGRDDLKENDQQIYDEIMSELQENSAGLK